MEERRVAPRWPIETSFLYQILEKETQMSPGFLHDINLRGAKIRLDQPLDIRSKLKMAIEIPRQADPIFTEGEVVWQKVSGGEFFTGIRFTFFKPADKERILKLFNGQIRQSWWR